MVWTIRKPLILKNIYFKKYIKNFLQVGAWRTWCRNDRTIISVAFCSIEKYVKSCNVYDTSQPCRPLYADVDVYANLLLSTTNWGWGRRVFLKSLSKSSNYYFNGHVWCNLQLIILISPENRIKEIFLSRNVTWYFIKKKKYFSLIARTSGAFISLRDIMSLNLNISLINLWNLKASLNTNCKCI